MTQNQLGTQLTDPSNTGDDKRRETDRVRQAEWSRTHREERRVINARYRASHRDAINAHNREWDREHPAEKAANGRTPAARAWHGRYYREHIRPFPERMKEKSRQSVIASRLKRFGVSGEEYDRMFAVQGGVCSICGRPPTERKALHVDHDHATGLVRKLLCHLCNTALGQFSDDPSVVLSAYVYLLTAKAP